MLKFITPFILLGVSITAFFMYINPAYKDIQELRSKQSSYDEALNNSNKLQTVKEELVNKYNNFQADDVKRLKKMLPDSVDNIRLIIDIDGIASKYGMKLTNVKYSVASKTNKEDSNIPTPVDMTNVFRDKPYDSFDLEFSTKGSYSNFISFVTDMEKSLRIVDINSISFSSIEGDTSTTPSNINSPYKYDFKIKTYWLKS